MPVRRLAVGCNSCGLLFVHPQPTAEALAAHYAADGPYRSRQKKAPATKVSTSAALPFLAALDRHLAASHPPAGSRMVDVGCGGGAWLSTFQERGWETYGIETSTDVAFQRHHRLEKLPDDGIFDLAMAHHVLEHLPRPLETLRAMARALKPNGHAIVSVPRVDTVHVYRDLGYCLQSKAHIVAFTEACLTGLLGRAGLGVVEPLHSLDTALTGGRPTSLRLLARKGASSPPVDPVAALKRIEALLPGLDIAPAPK